MMFHSILTNKSPSFCVLKFLIGLMNGETRQNNHGLISNVYGNILFKRIMFIMFFYEDLLFLRYFRKQIF